MAKESQKNIYFCIIDYAKAFDCVDHKKLGKILKQMECRPRYLHPEKPALGQEQQLEPVMEQRTGSKLRKE